MYLQINKRKQVLENKRRNHNKNDSDFRLSHDFREKSALKNPLPDEDDDMKQQVKEYLDTISVPYVKSQKTRDIKRGLIRIGTSFKLREDFYSAMWIYLHKVDYILP